MATAVTFMQGLVLLIIFGLHPRVVYVVRSRITSCIWWSQPEAELRSAVDRLRVMEQLVSADVTNSPVFNHGPSRSSYGTTSLRVEVGGATADAQVDAMRAMTMPLRVPVGGDIGGPGRAMPD